MCDEIESEHTPSDGGSTSAPLPADFLPTGGHGTNTLSSWDADADADADANGEAESAARGADSDDEPGWLREASSGVGLEDKDEEPDWLREASRRITDDMKTGPTPRRPRACGPEVLSDFFEDARRTTTGMSASDDATADFFDPDGGGAYGAWSWLQATGRSVVRPLGNAFQKQWSSLWWWHDHDHEQEADSMHTSAA
jgi:hypothetical protein